MALTQPQQILQMIERANRPLICVPEGAGEDGYSCAIGLATAMKKLGKDAEIVAADGRTPSSLSFLKGHEEVKDDFENLRRFVVELDASKTKVNELSYEMKDDRLLIHLSPKAGSWRPEDVKFSTTGFRFDLIIALGGSELASFGSLFERYPDFFYHTPIINIDHAPENEQFGHVNYVDVTASACGEICHQLFEETEPELVDEHVATAFLTGMIAKTRSFKHPRVTPKTLTRASALVAKGAARATIVEALYRTRSVNTLRLWGRALARLKVNEQKRIVWTLLSRQDFLHAGAQDQDLPDVIDELIATSPEAKTAMILFEREDGDIGAIVQSDGSIDVAQTMKRFNATGSRESATLKLKKKSIVAAEKLLLEALQN